jgi:hypothetical protein
MSSYQNENHNFSLNLHSIHSPNKLDILSIVSSTIVIKDYAILLTPVEIQYIHDIIHNDPELLAIIGNSVDSIMSDEVINLHDIPTIILLLSEIFKAHCAKNVIHDVGIIPIVRFILDSIMDYQYLPLPSVDRTIIKNIIDISFNLLESNVELKKELKTTWFSRIFCCFSTTPVAISE